MKKDSWLVVANSSLARIFKLHHKNGLTELKVLEHPESRLHNIDLVTDRPGRDFESTGTRRHALEPKVLPKQHEFEVFAKAISDYLENAFKLGEFDFLYISASPALLGLLRQSLHPNVLKLIKGEVDKDMTHMKPNEIPPLLPFLF
jgi:protein required for attachment to host cells